MPGMFKVIGCLYQSQAWILPSFLIKIEQEDISTLKGCLSKEDVKNNHPGMCL